MIRSIVAVSKNYVIGKNNKIPFYYPEDLKHFKKMTLNSNVIMGRNTFESIGKALPNRRNIVISSTKVPVQNIETYFSIEEAISYCKGDIWLIGGARIYEAGMNIVQEIHLTLTPDIIEENDCVKFPPINLDIFKIKEEKQFIPGDDTLIYYIFERKKCLQ